MDRVKQAVSWITVEPVELFYVLMFTTSNVVRDNLLIEKVCRLDLEYPEAACYNLTHRGSVEETIKNTVSKRVTDLEVIDGILVAIPALILSLFVGSWSDANGRRALLILPFIGNILSYTFYMGQSYWFEQIAPIHLLWGSVAGLTGGYVCINIGLYGYISDVTSAANRTMRLSILNGVFSAGYVIGTKLGGELFKHFQSFYANFGLSVALGVMGMLYALCFIEESVKKEGGIGAGDNDRRGFFSLSNVKDSLATAFKSRPNQGRARILILIVNFAIFMFCLNTVHYDYLLVINRYAWSASDYSDYLSVQRICRLTGLFVLLPFLSRLLKLSDALISSVGTVATIAAYLLLALGPSSWDSSYLDADKLPYISAALQFNSVITVTIRSQCTKEVEKSEIGRIFAVVALGQAIVPLIANPLFGLIYKATLDSLPGAYLLTIAVMLAFVLVSSIFMSIHDVFLRQQ